LNKVRYGKPRPLTLAQHYLGLKTSPISDGTGSLRGRKLIWHYRAQPTAMSRVYSLRIEFVAETRPAAYVEQPNLVALAGGRKLPHVYCQSPTELCLYRPGKREWTNQMLIDRTIVPWSILWLFFFEEWLASDDWKGGGEHVSVDVEAGTEA
jgi:hypothetical protein